MKNKISWKSAQRFVLRNKGFDPENLNKEDLAYKLVQQQDEINQIKRKHKFENNSFIMYFSDGTQGSINFNDKRGNGNMLCVFKVFYELLQKRAKLANGWSQVFVTKNEIKENLFINKKGEVSDEWIKNTISNLRQTKIVNSGLAGFIILGFYDRKRKAFPFQIRQI